VSIVDVLDIKSAKSSIRFFGATLALSRGICSRVFGYVVAHPKVRKTFIVSHVCKFLSHISIAKKIVRCAHPTVILCIRHWP
jgi:hypothetical protein